MHFGRRQTLQVVSHVLARYFRSCGQILAFSELSDHRGCRNRGGAAQRFKFDIRNSLLALYFFYFDINSHNIAASRIANSANAIRIFDLALILGVGKMFEDEFGIHIVKKLEFISRLFSGVAQRFL